MVENRTVNEQAGAHAQVPRLANTSNRVGQASHLSETVDALSINGVKKLLPAMLEYQPDLAVNTIASYVKENQLMPADIRPHLATLASLTNWLINTQSLIEIFRLTPSDDQAKFLNYVLIQDDTSGQRFFSALDSSQKKAAHSIIHDHVDAFSGA